MVSDDRAHEGQDPLYLTNVYPEAAAVFSYQPKPLADVFGTAVFVLDTNALLVPYGTDPASLGEIEKTYQSLKKQKRLVVPGQAAREFAKNRPENIKTIYDQLARRQSTNLTPLHYPMLSGLPNYEALLKLETEVAAKLDEYRAAIKDVLTQVKGWYWDDPVSTMYRKIFTDDAVVDPQQDASEVKKDFAFRTLHKVPPGYKDAGKELGASGDLIIWRTILEVGRAKKLDVIFVSGEEKADWWYRASDGVLYPRYELLDEFRRASGGKTFHIIRLAELLQRFGATPDVVEDVRERESVVNERWWVAAPKQAGFRQEAEGAVLHWLRGELQAKRDQPNVESFRKSDRVEVHVHGIKDATKLPGPWLRERVDRALVKAHKHDGLSLIAFVSTTRPAALSLVRRVSRLLDAEPSDESRFEMLFGYIENEAFQLVARRYEGRTILPPGTAL